MDERSLVAQKMQMVQGRHDNMTVEEFHASLIGAEPPAGLPVMVEALWCDAKGEWSRADNLVNDLETPDAMAVHAYLHRKEGETWNADYWYGRAGRQFHRPELGRVRTTRRASTMRAKYRKARKTTSGLSNLEEMRRKPLSRRKSLSISLRFLYSSRLCSITYAIFRALDSSFMLGRLVEAGGARPSRRG